MYIHPKKSAVIFFAILSGLFVLAVASTAFFFFWKQNFSQSRNVSKPKMDINKKENQPAEDINKTNSEKATLKGRIVMTDKDNSYLRISVKEEAKIYSVHISEDTKIMREEKQASWEDLLAPAEVTVFASDLPNTEKYDFEAEKIEITEISKLDEMEKQLDRIAPAKH